MVHSKLLKVGPKVILIHFLPAIRVSILLILNMCIFVFLYIQIILMFFSYCFHEANRDINAGTAMQYPG